MKTRVGNFSSSEIWKLMTKGRGAWSTENVGKPFLTYIKEKKWEERLGRSIRQETNARPVQWGRLVEEQAWHKLGFEYKLVSKDRIFHPTLERWCGIPDVRTEEMIGDIKCPWTINSFCELVELIENEDIEDFKKVKPEYYWQLVSNSILCDVDRAAFIAYCPYKKDLDKIRDLTQDYEDPNAVAFINFADDLELPHLKEDGGYMDLNVWEFEVPEEDKQLLIDRVEYAMTQL